LRTCFVLVFAWLLLIAAFVAAVPPPEATDSLKVTVIIPTGFMVGQDCRPKVSTSDTITLWASPHTRVALFMRHENGFARELAKGDAIDIGESLESMQLGPLPADMRDLKRVPPKFAEVLVAIYGVYLLQQSAADDSYYWDGHSGQELLRDTLRHVWSPEDYAKLDSCANAVR
jgi:hypothetical protein